MCGITATNFKTNESIQKLIKQRLIYRGPDNYQQLEEDNISFFHSRLSIQDLSSAGNQPMRDEKSENVIIFNGEIYNHLELRERFLKEYIFKGNSDTETLLVFLSIYDIDFVLKNIIGMFAFVFFEKEKNRIISARDKFGEKPLFYSCNSQGFIFSSDLKIAAAIKYQNSPYSISKKSIKRYLELGFFSGSDTAFNNVHNLRPGSYLIYNLYNNEFQINSYFNFSERPRERTENIANSSYIKNLTISSFETAIKRTLISDVPVGVLLSGGVDSSLVSYFASKSSNPPFMAFNLSFSSDEDESIKAIAISKKLKIPIKVIKVNELQLIKKVKSLISSLDQPLADPSTIPTYILFNSVKKDCKVVLSGDGADELFYGYERYIALKKYAFLMQLPLSIKKALILLLKILTFFSKYLFLSSKNLRQLRKLYDFMAAKTEEEIYISLVGTGLHKYMKKSESQKLTFKDDIVNFIRTKDIESYMCDSVLVKVDRCSMMNGVEARTPFFDPEIVKLSSSLPRKIFLDNRDGKKLLKKLKLNFIGLSSKGKQGFSPPIDDWLREALFSWCNNLLKENIHLLSWAIDMEAVDSLWLNHQKGQNNTESLWAIIVLLGWLRSLEGDFIFE